MSDFANSTTAEEDKLERRRKYDRDRYSNNPTRKAQTKLRAKLFNKKPKIVARRKQKYARERLLFLPTSKLNEVRADLTDDKTRGICRICGVYARKMPTGIEEFGAIEGTHLKSHTYLWKLHQAGLLPQSFPLGASKVELEIKSLDEYVSCFGFTKSNSMKSPKTRARMRANYYRRGGNALAANARSHRRTEWNPRAFKGIKHSEEMRQRRRKFMNRKITNFLFGKHNVGPMPSPQRERQYGPDPTPPEQTVWFENGRKVEELIPRHGQAKARHMVARETKRQYSTIEQYHKRYRAYMRSRHPE